MAKVTWERCLLVFCCSFSLFCSNIVAYLDLEELKTVHYDIDILSTPVLLGRPVAQEVFHLRSKYGQQYECQLPDMTDYTKDHEEEKMAADMGISELLKPMENAPCLIKTKDWWSYEYCHGRHVKQYHLEDGKIKGEVVFLGYYESEMDWNNKTHKDAKRHRLNRYHSHTYVNGTTCDLTNKPRETEVRFVCAEGQGDSISRIDEPSSCVYILTVRTSRTCHHPYLRPPPSLKARPVLCHPALEQDQYQKYLEVKQESSKSKERHFIAFGSSEVIRDDPPPAEAETARAPAEELGIGQERQATAETALEPSLQEDLDESGVDVDGLEEALAMGADPSLLNHLVKNVLKSVQDSVKKIDSEIQDKPKPGMEPRGTADEVAQEDDDDEEEEEEEEEEEDMDDDLLRQTGLDLEALEEAMDLEDEEELEALMEEDVDTLLARYRAQIGQLTSDPAEMMQLHEMMDSIQGTLQEIEAINSLIDEETALNGLGDLEDLGEDKEGKRLLAATLKHLMKENGQSQALPPRAPPRDDKEPASPSSSSSSASPSSSSSPHSTRGGIKLKVTKMSLSKDNKVAEESVRETDVYDSDHRPIEDAIMLQMEKAGVNIDNNKDKVEFQILAYTVNEWPEEENDDGVTILTEEESTYFKNVVMGLLGRGAESAEQQRHERLESNYRFVWEPQGATDFGTGDSASDGLGAEEPATEQVEAEGAAGESREAVDGQGTGAGSHGEEDAP